MKKIFLSLLIVALTTTTALACNCGCDCTDPIIDPICLPPPPTPVPVPNALNRLFHLTFKYACREGLAFSTCQGNVIWNDAIIWSIVPGDHNIHTASIDVYVNAGENRLQFEGTGESDSLGLIIDDVSLIRDGTLVNIVINGGFENPNTGTTWGIFTNILGWEGFEIEVGRGTIYNSGWGSQACELDGNRNYQITQRWQFDTNFYLVQLVSCDAFLFNGETLPFQLTFDWSARTAGVSSTHTSRGNVLWNNVVVGSMNPTDYLVKHASITVQLRPGKNILQFDGAGPSDSYGLLVDEAKVKSSYWLPNLVFNGNFENPALANGQWTYAAGGIAHWVAVNAEVGDLKDVYNGNWADANSQGIELDSNGNQRYTQVIDISPTLFGQMLIAKKLQTGLQNVQTSLSSEPVHPDFDCGCHCK